MTVNIPARLRLALYIFTVFGSLLVTYLTASGVMGTNEVSLWTGFTAAIAAMAGFNTPATK